MIVDPEKLLEDLMRSEEGSIEEQVCIDIFMNEPTYLNDINFVRAFHGPIIRGDVISILDRTITDIKKKEITKSLRITLPGILKKISDAIKSYKK